MEKKEYVLELGGKPLTVQLTPLAEQANGRVLVRLGDTLVLATAVMSKNPREGGDFFPLLVDYEEKFYAAGKILGSRFIKRETRPSDAAILIDRLIDRTIRPRFNQKMRNDVQVVITVLSIDDENDPDVVGVLAASLALALSDIPWDGPVAAVRVGKINGNFILNPSYQELETSALDLVVSGTEDKINMLEGGAEEMGETEILEAVRFGQEAIQKLTVFEKKIIQEMQPAKKEVILPIIPEELNSLMKRYSAQLENALYEKNKNARQEKVEEVKKEWLASAEELLEDNFTKQAAEFIFDEEINVIIHRRIIEKGERPDGRRPDELRSLWGEVGLLPRVHGSALFVRGQTQALSTLTLGSPGDEQIVEGMEIRTKRRFMHHYNFPPFSTGEVKPMRGPGRREIGHGALAERALMPLIPTKEEFPYTIRLVSEILSSNGSSSMASVCGSSMALMDAGVPIKKAAAGIAMGLMMDDKGHYKVLTDIQGPEDHHGDMDFKAAGTRDGITALQMDVKIEGVTLDILKDTWEQSRKARMEIIDFMETLIKTPRPELSPYAPRIVTLHINPDKIRDVIGPGGKMINEIIAETRVDIDIEDDGTIFVTSEKEEGMKRAVEWIQNITREVKPGEIFEGKVTRIFNFGAMVEILPKQEGLIHISELAPWRVNEVSDIVSIGDVVKVIVKDIDEQGRINLSLKAVPGQYSQEEIQKHFKSRSSTPRSSIIEEERPYGESTKTGGRKMPRSPHKRY